MNISTIHKFELNELKKKKKTGVKRKEPLTMLDVPQFIQLSSIYRTTSLFQFWEL